MKISYRPFIIIPEPLSAKEKAQKNLDISDKKKSAKTQQRKATNHEKKMLANEFFKSFTKDISQKEELRRLQVPPDFPMQNPLMSTDDIYQKLKKGAYLFKAENPYHSYIQRKMRQDMASDAYLKAFFTAHLRDETYLDILLNNKQEKEDLWKAAKITKNFFFTNAHVKMLRKIYHKQLKETIFLSHAFKHKKATEELFHLNMEYRFFKEVFEHNRRLKHLFFLDQKNKNMLRENILIAKEHAWLDENNLRDISLQKKWLDAMFFEHEVQRFFSYKALTNIIFKLNNWRDDFFQHRFYDENIHQEIATNFILYGEKSLHKNLFDPGEAAKNHAKERFYLQKFIKSNQYEELLDNLLFTRKTNRIIVVEHGFDIKKIQQVIHKKENIRKIKTEFSFAQKKEYQEILENGYFYNTKTKKENFISISNSKTYRDRESGKKSLPLLMSFTYPAYSDLSSSQLKIAAEKIAVESLKEHAHKKDTIENDQEIARADIRRNEHIIEDKKAQKATFEEERFLQNLHAQSLMTQVEQQDKIEKLKKNLQETNEYIEKISTQRHQKDVSVTAYAQSFITPPIIMETLNKDGLVYLKVELNKQKSEFSIMQMIPSKLSGEQVKELPEASPAKYPQRIKK